MRDIKFRAISTKTGKWVYGHIAYHALDTAYYIHESWDIAPCMSEPGGSVHYAVHEVDPKTIGEYTGLKDKAGCEIFEGDLLLIRADLFDTDTKGHEVFFGNYSIGRDDYGIEHQTACFCIKFNDDSGYCGIDEEVLVIGNIHERLVKG